MLTIRDLSKTYPNGVRALQSVSLDIPNGMFGLLGPNGAGKSTLMRTIATLQDPDSGSIKLGDLDVLADKPGTRRVLGYLPQEFGVYPKVTAEAMLDHFAVLKGITTREDAERINGLELYISRDTLPETEEGEYYHADLIGLRALDPAGAMIGKVLAVHNFGAGDIIEIAPPEGATLLLPFTDAVVPTVDLTGGHVVIVMPQEIEGDSPSDADI